MKNSIVVLMLSFFTLSAVAQQGFVRGKITDGETGEGLYGATVVKQGTGIGTVADFDGNFSLPLDPGVHTIIVTFVSYQTKTVENVEVKSGQVTTVDFVMASDVAQLGEVIISGDALKDTESAMLTLQRKSANLVDAVSNQTFRKTGDSDLSSAMKRVTGVSVMGGKFVYVRGLGDRYTRTTLNGMTIPGLDPDRNDVQIDIFPTSILENVVVYKTSSPNLPGDFTGGIVDVETKNFPEEKVTSVSFGLGFNPDMNVKSDFLTYEGGRTNALGFDDGTRKLPFAEQSLVPAIQSNNRQLETLTRSLNPTLAVQKQRSFLNTSFAFNHGNQINKERFTIGYSAIFSYQNRFEHYDDAEFGEYTKSDDRATNALFAEEVRKGALSRNSVLWSGLLAGAIKTEKHNLAASVFRTQNGVSEASERINSNFDQTNATLYENILTFSQRAVTTGILSGTHQLNKLKMQWKNAYTIARTYDPDFRTTSISISNEEPSLNRGDGAGISRFWRDLNEMNENLKVDFTLPYGKANKLQFGGSGLYKKRDFEVLSYLIDATQRSNVSLDPNSFLRPENIWTPEKPADEFAVYLQGNYEAPNNYKANASVYTGYLMTEMTLVNKLKAVYGVRMEKASMFYTGVNTSQEQFDNVKTFDELNFLPSVNLVYSVTDVMSVRGSYGKTLARPSFKEKSAATIYDPITKRFFNGNLDLTQTMIDNFDIRWENFLPGGDLISVSGFYKKFDGHIELVTFDVETSNVRPRNAGESSVIGMEFEVRKNLAFVNPALSDISFGANVSLASSSVDTRSVIINESGLTEFESRQNNAREGERIKSTRQMGGQAPYLINAFLNYADQDGIFNANLSYNVQGESLSVIGVGGVPDVYTQPFNSLNLNVYRNFGTDQKHRLTLGATNLLDQVVRDKYKGYGNAEASYSLLRPGRTYSLTYAIKL